MTDPIHRHDSPDAAVNPRLDVGDQNTRRTRLLSRQCATCIFRPGNPMHLAPGRLHHLIADARAAEGYIICHDTLPTATPWQRRTPLPPVKPTLHLGVLVDVSGSMRAYTAPLSAAAWILTHAAHRNQAVAATLAFADRVTVLIPPRQAPRQVLEMAAGGGTSTFTHAVKLADQLLDLRHQRTLRLLAVVSDGDLPDPEPAQKLITTLARAGCAVLWLRPHGMPGHTYTDTTTITVADPLDAIAHLGDAAVTALEHA